MRQTDGLQTQKKDEFMSLLTWKGGTLEAPLPPVLVSCGTMEKPNALTIAWSGIINTIPPMTYISVRPERYSYDLIRESGEFVINLPTEKLVRSIDYCGVRSGRSEDKIAACGLHLAPGETVQAPLILESPVHLECSVTEIKELGSHHMFLAKINAVRVDDSVVDEKGKLRMDQCHLAAYIHGNYYSIGKELGKFGFSVEKKKKKHR